MWGELSSLFQIIIIILILRLKLLEIWELTISKDYLQAAINIYPDKRIEMYSNQEISNQLDQIDEQYYADHEIEYFDFIDKYTEENIVKMDEIMFKIGAFSKLT